MKGFGLFFGFSIACIVWVMAILGMLSIPRGIVYDILTKFNADNSDAGANILLIEADYGNLNDGDKTWLKLLDNLISLKAGQIIFSFMPENATDDFFKRASEFPGLFFGRPLISGPGYTRLGPIPTVAKRFNFSTRIWALPRPDYGPVRKHKSNFMINGKSFPNVIVEAAEQRLGQNLDLEDQFWVKFSGIDHGLPNVRLTQFLEGNIVPRLVENRTVIVGTGIPPGLPGIRTSIWNDMLSPLAFNGFAYNTLISGGIRQSGPFTSLAWIFFFVGAGMIVFQVFPAMLTLWIGSVLFLAIMGIGWLSLVKLGLFLPVFETGLGLFFLMAAIFWNRSKLKDRWAVRTVLDRSTKTKSMYFPESFYASEEYWSQIINMVNETLSLKRAIFLEGLQNDHRVKEVISLNCSISDIAERRRDYHRTPYLTAINEGRPILAKRFFENTQEDEDPYLVALEFNGHIQGFWVFSVTHGKEKESPGFLENIKGFAGEIAQLLYQRRLWQVHQKNIKNPLKRLLAWETGTREFQEIDKIMSMMEIKLNALESMFEELGTATIHYDIFGRVVQINRKMTDILTTLNMHPYEMSATDLLGRFTGQDYDKSRQMISDVVIGRETVSVRVVLPEDEKETFILTLRPLTMDEEKIHNRDEAYPFNLLGILFEITDISEIKTLDFFKNSLFMQSHAILKKETVSLSKSLSMLESKDIPDDRRHEIVRKIQEKQNGIMNFITEFGSYMEKDMITSGIEVFPINPEEPVMKAIKAIQPEADKRGVRFNVSGMNGGALVLAPPGRLVEFFNTLLAVLVEDTASNTIVNVAIRKNGQRVIYHLANTGFGIPNDDFQRFLAGISVTGSKHLGKLSSMVREISSWRGSLSGTSDVGDGINFELSLKQYTMKIDNFESDWDNRT